MKESSVPASEFGNKFERHKPSWVIVPQNTPAHRGVALTEFMLHMQQKVVRGQAGLSARSCRPASWSTSTRRRLAWAACAENTGRQAVWRNSTGLHSREQRPGPLVGGIDFQGALQERKRLFLFAPLRQQIG